MLNSGKILVEGPVDSDSQPGDVSKGFDVERPHTSGLGSAYSSDGSWLDNSNQIERHAHWLTISKLQIGDIVGIGILSLGSAFGFLGWFPALLFAIGFLPLNIYLSLKLHEARNYYPEATNLVIMARKTINIKWFTVLTGLSLYFLLILILASYVQVLAGAGKAIFYTSIDGCNYAYGLVSLILLLIPGVMTRTLNETRVLLWVNAAAIVVTVVLTVGFMLHELADGKFPDNETEVVASGMTWLDFFGGFSQLAFAYNGMVIFLDMMAEMKNPNDWPKTFTVSGPFQLCLYLLVGITSYIALGQAAKGQSLLNYLPMGSAVSIIANILLYMYVFVAYLIKGNVVTRCLHRYFFPITVTARTSKSYFHWGLCYCITLAVTYLIGMGIPVFSQLIALTGSLLVPFTGFILPVMFVLSVRKKNGVKTSVVEMIGFVLILIVFTILTFVGTAANVVTIIDSYETQTAFYC